jgi:cytosine/adenosine deaminase-related metal-dependent hydrolase
VVAFINARIMDAAEPATVHIRDGVIIAIDGTQPTRETIDCGGRVALRGPIEPHLHLDDALLDLIETKR